MAFRDFDAARRAVDQQLDHEVRFRLGGEDFTCMSSPSLGDTFDVADAPDIDPDAYDGTRTADLELVRTLVRFIRRMLDPKDRNRLDDVVHRIPATEAHLVIRAAHWITEQVTTFPTEPPASSSSGRHDTGPESTTSSDGTTASS